MYQKILIPPYDIKINPGDNFYLYVNNNWLNKINVPNYLSSYSVNEEIENNINIDLFSILDDCEKNNDNEKNDFKTLIGNFILSSKSSKSVSLNYLLSKIQNLNTIKTIDDIGEVLGYLCKHKINTLLETYLILERTKENKSIYTLVLNQGVLGLPDKYYYLNNLNVYQELCKHLSKLLKIDDISNSVILESFFSKYLNDTVTGELYEGNELLKEFPTFPWKSFFISYGIENFEKYIFRIEAIEWIRLLEKSFKLFPIEDFKQLFIFNMILHALPYLPEPFNTLNYQFFEKSLNGQKKKISQKHLTLLLCKEYISVPLSILYKEKFLKLSLKTKATKFIESIRKSSIEQIETNIWLQKKTKKEAVEKIKNMVLSIGWPEKYPKYNLSVINKNNLLENIYTLSSASVKEDIELLNKESKPGVTWKEPSFIVNAYYYNEINEFIIPAGTLFYPFFGDNCSLGWNYGGLGAVIGHEMIHAFDNDGKEYDEYGIRRKWWLSKDDYYYKIYSKKLIHLFNSSKIYDNHINGEKTLNENIADLGGLSVALEALKKEIKLYDKKKEKYELQQFFLSYAVSWRTKDEKKRVLENLITDVHSPPELRVNNIVNQFDEWYEVFDIKVGNKMFIEPHKRIRVF
uniref:Peptidase M13 C-terminal domain-containing protein n=1 Tax=viral metagenome TaxID=1070528 RepID=A0A6C0IF84_9ZZZZ